MAADYPTLEEKTPQAGPGNYSPVTVLNEDTIGALFLGILSIILLTGWVRAEARIRDLLVNKGNENP